MHSGIVIRWVSHQTEILPHEHSQGNWDSKGIYQGVFGGFAVKKVLASEIIMRQISWAGLRPSEAYLLATTPTEQGYSVFWVLAFILESQSASRAGQDAPGGGGG